MKAQALARRAVADIEKKGQNYRKEILLMCKVGKTIIPIKWSKAGLVAEVLPQNSIR